MLHRILTSSGKKLRGLFRFFGFGLVRTEELNRLRLESEFAEKFFRKSLEHRNNFSKARSQIGQDLMVLGWLEGKQSGFFVEFGATDGRTLSNTYLLEKYYGWTGILAEPGRVWHSKLRKNRDCYIDERAVWVESSISLEFNEVEEACLSTLNSFSKSDFHSVSREQGKIYKVETVSLRDLLDCYDAPEVIDYLSIDTEGSEFEILSRFDFTEYRFRVISVEHNGTERKKDIFELLSAHGYSRVLTGCSRWDNWYVSSEQALI